MLRNSFLTFLLSLCLAGCGTQEDGRMAKATGKPVVTSSSTAVTETVAERQTMEGLNRIAAKTSNISTPLQTLVGLPNVSLGFQEVEAELRGRTSAGDKQPGKDDELRKYTTQLKAKVESRLKESGIEVFKPQGLTGKGKNLQVEFALKMMKIWVTPTLDLEVKAFRLDNGLYVYKCDLFLKEHVTLSRNPAMMSLCPVWRANAVIGTAVDRSSLLQSVEAYTLRSTDQFIRDYKDANDKEFNKPFEEPRKE